VVRLQLGQLAALERDEILKEFHELRSQIRGYEELLASERNILAVIRKDTEHLRDKYGEERKTQSSTRSWARSSSKTSSPKKSTR